MRREPPPEDRVTSGRRAARLAAVQALYQIEIAGTPTAQAIDEFVIDHLPLDADCAFFNFLVRSVEERQDEIDRLISAALVDGWSLTRLEAVLRAVFRAAVCELVTRGDIPPRVTITQYVDIAYSFFAGREPGMVNGVLDAIARQIRAAELGPDVASSDTKA